MNTNNSLKKTFRVLVVPMLMLSALAQAGVALLPTVREGHRFLLFVNVKQKTKVGEPKVVSGYTPKSLQGKVMIRENTDGELEYHYYKSTGNLVFLDGVEKSTNRYRWDSLLARIDDVDFEESFEFFFENRYTGTYSGEDVGSGRFLLYDAALDLDGDGRADGAQIDSGILPGFGSLPDSRRVIPIPGVLSTHTVALTYTYQDPAKDVYPADENALVQTWKSGSSTRKIGNKEILEAMLEQGGLPGSTTVSGWSLGSVGVDDNDTVVAWRKSSSGISAVPLPADLLADLTFKEDIIPYSGIDDETETFRYDANGIEIGFTGNAKQKEIQTHRVLGYPLLALYKGSRKSAAQKYTNEFGQLDVHDDILNNGKLNLLGGGREPQDDSGESYDFIIQGTIGIKDRMLMNIVPYRPGRD